MLNHTSQSIYSRINLFFFSRSLSTVLPCAYNRFRRESYGRPIRYWVQIEYFQLWIIVRITSSTYYQGQLNLKRIRIHSRMFYSKIKSKETKRMCCLAINSWRQRDKTLIIFFFSLSDEQKKKKVFFCSLIRLLFQLEAKMSIFSLC